MGTQKEMACPALVKRRTLFGNAQALLAAV
jgi:hypothetical protein